MHESEAGTLMSAKPDCHWFGWRSLPPQYMTVAVQLFATVRGSITLAALAGYVRTA